MTLTSNKIWIIEITIPFFQLVTYHEVVWIFWRIYEKNLMAISHFVIVFLT